MKIRLMLTVIMLFTTVFAGCRSTQRYTAVDTSSHSPPRRSSGQWGGQKTCPVTGEALGSMGDPIAVPVQDHTVWVCCEGCVAAVKEDPEKYLQQVRGDRVRRPGSVVPRSAAHDHRGTGGGVSSSSGSCPSCRSR
ncbi:MAG: hypothetical protein JST16_15995 [Bdellovibrionales bacterium]|nr:hypothetical protein [Bdellovibrionales bacterium]